MIKGCVSAVHASYLPCPGELRREAAAEIVDGPADDDVVVEGDIERDEDCAVPDTLVTGIKITPQILPRGCESLVLFYQKNLATSH